jgi:hypothetical protein
MQIMQSGCSLRSSRRKYNLVELHYQGETERESRNEASGEEARECVPLTYEVCLRNLDIWEIDRPL